MTEKEEEIDKLKEYYESELKQRDRQIEDLKQDNDILLKTAMRQAERKIIDKELKKAKEKKK